MAIYAAFSKSFCFFCILFLLATAGCGGKSVVPGQRNPIPPSQKQQPQKPPTSRLSPQAPAWASCPAPLRQKGFFLLSQAEVQQQLKGLGAARQGLKSWQDMSFAVEQSLAHASRKPAQGVALSGSTPKGENVRITWGMLAATQQKLLSILPQLDTNLGLLATQFNWYRIGPDFSFTGYYEPSLQASKTPSAKYYYPIYKKPTHLKTGDARLSRHSIDRKGSLRNKGLEIAWVDSEVDAFFLHVQGSGRLVYPDGTVTHVLYRDKNGHRYVALGRIMKEQGLLAEDDVNMQSIKAWLAKNPGRVAELLDKNPSYIFFHEKDKGPLGAMGRPLTPWVSTATDNKVLPHGSLTLISMPLPDSDGVCRLPLHALTLPQDAGGAIKGHRVDYFCGPSSAAQHIAGYQDAPGAVFVLIAK